MKSSYQIAKIAGIPVKVHFTFGLILIWFAWDGYDKGFDLTGILLYLLFILTLFVCVIMHEFGHALTARRYGVPTKDIIITPIGGVARLTKLPSKPVQELLIALMGPMVNVGIALVLGIGLFFFNDGHVLPDMVDYFRFGSLASFLQNVFILNIVLVVFNMIPAFPMDGGRVLRALLSMRWNKLVSTKIAAIIGQTICVLFVIFGYWSDMYTWTLIGFFIFFMASMEYRGAKFEYIVNTTRAVDIATADYISVNYDDVMQSVFEHVKAKGLTDVPVRYENRSLAGYIPARAVEQAIHQNDFFTPVTNYIHPFEYKVLPETLIKNLYTLFNAASVNMVVLDDEDLSKIIFRDDLSEILNDSMKVNPFFWWKDKTKYKPKPVS